MKKTATAGQGLPDHHFEAVRLEILRASQRMSCHQALDLADLLHAVIRMRKRRQPLVNVHRLIADEVADATPRRRQSDDKSFAEPKSWMTPQAS
jgi:hypothetical protein